MTFAWPMESESTSVRATLEERAAFLLFLVTLAVHLGAMTVGWSSKALPGVEFRQAQTALSAYWIQADGDFSLAYPTPVLGKPWSVPMEFPLYQWTVVAVSDLTHWSLTKAGRAVSIACFYLCLPAVFLLLDRWAVPRRWRWLALAVVVTCPLYVFYARSFLIETMALMFSLWFWVAFERAVVRRSKVWWAVAAVTGAGAGLVKVTTLMLYLLPMGVWAIKRGWQARGRGERVRELAWMGATVAVPFALTLAWLHYADGIKALNPLGRFLTSANLKDFNLGTSATRFSPETWAMQWRIVRDELTAMPALILCGIVAGVTGRARLLAIAGCLAGFMAALVIFPVLYALHDYYYLANTLLLLLAMGLAITSLAESRSPRWVVAGVVLLLLGAQVLRYRTHYYPSQQIVQAGGSGLTDALRALTNPNDVLVIAGQDWSSIVPYYARRRALMFRQEMGADPQVVEEALERLGPDPIGALVVAGDPPGRQWLVDRAEARGLTREPVLVWHDVAVYLPAARRTELIHAAMDNNFPEVQLAPGVKEPREGLSATWLEVGALRTWQQRYFASMSPRPVRCFATFGPTMDGSSGIAWYGAHPETRLVFRLDAGSHVLRATLQMPLDAYREELSESEASDGVDVTLFALEPDGQRRVLATRRFDPRHNPTDRGPSRPLEFSFSLPAAGEVELFFGAGPKGSDTRDWIQLGPLTIQ